MDFVFSRKAAELHCKQRQSVQTIRTAKGN